MKVKDPVTINTTICLPCDVCGKEVRTVSLYLQGKSDRKIPKGFYSDLSVRICEECVDEMKKALSE